VEKKKKKKKFEQKKKEEKWRQKEKKKENLSWKATILRALRLPKWCQFAISSSSFDLFLA